MKKFSDEIWFIVFSLFALLFIIYIANPYLELSRRPEVKEEQPIKLVWGFSPDSVHVDTFRVRQGQNLSDILIAKGVSLTEIDLLARNAQPIFDVRRIKAGNPYYLLCDNEGDKPTCFIYEENMVNYYTFHLTDSLRVEKGMKDVDTIRTSFAGVIESSLWNSFISQGANPSIAIALSDIYAWTVDFFGIQKGDKYKVFYDQYSVDEKFAGMGKIYAALFETSWDTIVAIYFDEKGQAGFYDKDGNSLKKAFLKAPLNYSRISSKFSNSRMHPVLKIRRAHHGVDYAAPTGTPILSIGDGVVVKKAYQSGGGGNYINIKHNSVYTSQYMHLSKYAKGIDVGTRVKQGQLIGYVGMTGLASGPHLDFRIFFNGKPVDPLRVESPPVEPIKAENRERFYIVRDSILSILDTIPYPN